MSSERISPKFVAARTASSQSGGLPWTNFARHNSWLFYLAPAVLVMFSITVIPFFYLIYNSLTDWDLRYAYRGKNFIGLENYMNMAGDDLFLKSIWVTILASVGIVVVELLLGMLLAQLFHRDFFGKRLIRSLFLLPLITTRVVVGLTWRMLFNSDLGMINYFLAELGLPEPVWLASTELALPSIILADAWNATPFVTLMFVAGLQSIPLEPYEAAQVDGASPLQRYFYITLPQLRPLIFLVLMFRVTDAIRIFDIIFVMTSGGPANATQTLNMYTYKVGFVFLNMGYGSALALILMLVSIVLSYILVRYSGLELEGVR